MQPPYACCALAVIAATFVARVATAGTSGSTVPTDTGSPSAVVAPVWVRTPPPNDLRAPNGLMLGLRLGVAHPGGMVGAGSIATTPRVSDLAETWVPIGFDVGYRLAPGAYIGATFVWGGTFGDDSARCIACGFRYDFQALTDLRYYPFPNSTVSPWLSFGTGWEVMHVNFNTTSSTATAEYQGPVLANFQIGLDFRKGPVAIGPYFGVELAEFAFHDLDPAPPGSSSRVGALAVHEWYTLGVHGSLGP